MVQGQACSPRHPGTSDVDCCTCICVRNPCNASAHTGQARFKRYGLMILKWTLIAGFGFFAVLILERVA